MRLLADPPFRTTSAIGRGLVLFALPLALVCACKSSAPDERAAAPDKPGSELTVQKFQELISQGALKPVHAMEDDPYAQTKPDMDEDVFAKAVERLKTGEVPAAAKSEQAPAEGAKPAEPPNFFPENPYLKFGKRIQVYPESGLIMKPFPLKLGTGQALLDLIKTYGFFPLYDAADPKAGV